MMQEMVLSALNDAGVFTTNGLVRDKVGLHVLCIYLVEFMKRTFVIKCANFLRLYLVCGNT